MCPAVDKAWVNIMTRKIGTLAMALAALTLIACGTLPTERSGAGASRSNAVFLGNETITLKSLPLGREIQGYTCGAQRALVCTDNGLWSRCRCSQ